jgi:hypothetical protein
MWKEGLINREHFCDVLLKFNDKQVCLSVRMLNIEKCMQFKNQKATDYLKRIHFEYMLSLMQLFLASNTVFQVKFLFFKQSFFNYFDGFLFLKLNMAKSKENFESNSGRNRNIKL